MTLTYNPSLAKVKVDPHAKNQGQRSNGSVVRTLTSKQANRQTDGRTIANAVKIKVRVLISRLLADMIPLEIHFQ